jgi:hypothetical protein
VTDELDELIPPTIRETLDAVVSPSVRDAVLQEALEDYGDRSALRDGEGFQRFVEGPLRDALIRALGEDLGDSVTEEIARMAALGPTSSAPPASPPPRHSRNRGRSLSPASVQRAGPSRTSSSPPSQSPRPRRNVSPRPTTLRARLAPTAPPPKVWPESQRARRAEQFAENAESPSRRGERREVASPSSSSISDDPRALPRTEPSFDFSPVTSRPEPSSRPAPPPSSAQHPRGTATALGVLGARRAASDDQPVVLIATRDLGLTRRMRAWLDPRATVQRVASLLAVLQGLEAARHVHSVVVIDCNDPSFRPVALAAVAEELPRHTRVVVWGASDSVKRDALALSARAQAWLFTAAHVAAKDIADQCAALVS